jgi:hypothetical protein
LPVINAWSRLNASTHQGRQQADREHHRHRPGQPIKRAVNSQIPQAQLFPFKG